MVLVFSFHQSPNICHIAHVNFVHCLYLDFFFAKGLLSAKTDSKVQTEVLQDGNDFTWTQTTPNLTWSNKFTTGQECELLTMTGSKFKVSRDPLRQVGGEHGREEGGGGCGSAEKKSFSIWRFDNIH